jgi:hypothetical protein
MTSHFFAARPFLPLLDQKFSRRHDFSAVVTSDTKIAGSVIIGRVSGSITTGYPSPPFERISRVARWYIFKPKIPIWVNFSASCKERCWPFYCHFVYFMAIWYVFGSFWYIFPVLVCCAEKNLATLRISMRVKRRPRNWVISNRPTCNPGSCDVVSRKRKKQSQPGWPDEFVKKSPKL